MKKLNELVNIQKLKERLTPANHSTFSIWKNTALEICRDKYEDICNLYNIYMEIPEEELRVDQLILFIDDLVDIMPTLENKKSLITAEAFSEKVF